MNRRRFLSFLGLAPVAAAVPVMALPRAEKPHELDKLVIDVQPADPEVYHSLMQDIAKRLVDSTADECAAYVDKLVIQTVIV